MLNEFESILVSLYDTPAKARTVTDRAGIPSQHIDMDGAMHEVWHGIVTEAARRRQLIDLVRAATAQYPARTELWELLIRHERSEKEAGWFSMTPRGESNRGDTNPTIRLEQNVERLDQIINGTDWGAEGLLLKVDKLIKNQAFNRRVLILLAVIEGILALAVGVALSGIWRPIG